MKYQVYNQQGEKVKQTELNSAIFGITINQGLVHQAAITQLANSRQTLAHTKDRGAVRGGGKKPWKQKGTGRARHGSTRSPIWIGGGVTFGPTKNRNFSKKINKKMKSKALFMCLTDRVADNQLVLVDSLTTKNSKTKEFVEIVKNLKDVLGLQQIVKKQSGQEKKEKTSATKKTKKFDIKKYKISILVITSKDTAKVSKIARNIPGIKITNANSLNVVDILKHKNLLMDEGSLKVLDNTYIR